MIRIQSSQAVALGATNTKLVEDLAEEKETKVSTMIL